MVPGRHRPAVVRVDLSAIRENVAEEVKRLKPKQKLFAVVKANAYGHGAIPVAKTALKAGADGFCVALLDEALELRQAGIVKPILVLGVTPAEDAPLAAVHDVSLAVPNLAWLKQAEQFLQEEQLQLKIHLAIDSGMGRIGFSEDDEFVAANKFLTANKSFFIEGMFTHFASADSSDERYFQKQVARFNHMKELLTIKPKWIHVDNTAASVFDKNVPSDIVRFGIGIYGLNPSSNPASPDLHAALKLRPALSLVSELTHVKIIHQGDGVGYGSTYVADGDQVIGTVPVGYADGWLRKFQGFKVKVGDSYCPIVGRVCMDQFMVRLPQTMPVGTKVVLISNDPAEPNNIKAAADYLDTIHYEVACMLNDRLPRVYDNE
ncbi:alanine racemase [Lactobacillus sp. ESL0791]|uniref:alanine racemase n=1 Tax=Lactobacillus sp. ESL0791 TaxID=2983234 RepID=UPI0023F90CDF|nr:alanine racemase [Lactobacillus sp. ESL0791]MDF7639483.1 alanine racemase [Lactobacillus sp. ESL0791]